MFFVISSPFLSTLLTSFSIATEKVKYFSKLFPKQVNCSYFSASFFYDKIRIIVKSILKNYGNLGYFKLRMLYAAPLYSSLQYNDL